jgi:UbiA prenyltransferase family
VVGQCLLRCFVTCLMTVLTSVPFGVRAGRRIATTGAPWLRLARVHQYAKNVLLFVPLLTSQTFGPHSILLACMAAVAFSLCASSVYIFNDLVDLAADRGHPSKRRRPLACGAISLRYAVAIVPALLILALIIAVAVSWVFFVVLICYIGMTTAYSIWLKRKLMVDVIVLAMLYTVRVIGGAAAIDVAVSEWLLAFSLMIFTSLALTKRNIELASLEDANLGAPVNRNYRLGDMLQPQARESPPPPAAAPGNRGAWGCYRRPATPLTARRSQGGDTVLRARPHDRNARVRRV